MMIALPNLDGSFTVTCFFPFEGENGFQVLDNAEDDTLIRFFERDFADAVPLMPNLKQDWKRNPTSSLVTVRCFPWAVENKCCLFGTC
jgi:kynurenine 3-monooxygenase